jgi:ABC-type antimicrobial peptide transport system permease subunit
VKNTGLDKEDSPTMYLSSLQVPPQRSSVLVVRTKQEPDKLAAPIRSVIRSQDKDQSVSGIETMTDVVNRSLSPERFNMVLFTLFAAIAALLSAVGIYAVMANSVIRKMHELGIRIALGAQRKDLVMMVLKQGMQIVGIGLMAGIAISLSGAGIMSSLLFEMNPEDPKILFCSLLMIGVLALASCLVPAFKASRIDAQTALRFE